MRGSYQPFSSWKSATNMWSVKICPKPRSPSFGLVLSVVARVILMGSVMSQPPPGLTSPTVGHEGARRQIKARSKNNGLPIQAEHLAVHVGDLPERDDVLHRLHETRHTV